MLCDYLHMLGDHFIKDAFTKTLFALLLSFIFIVH